MPPPSLYFKLFGGALFGRTDSYIDTKIVIIIVYVAFLRLFHMTYCSETIDTKTAGHGRKC
jgi:hypothetical protein